ncbi:NUDIX hydrolase [Alteribacillus iranensis]|uniref:8-oxo-dGTP diphosphatase n=1 Tax=Alteribacillus iranensis TaxID=930128 RepID=A0A1I2EL16_9BACI|nr:8-oxo-dGTP diphosphatase [Alteribacillus iranensis]SFE93702.1 8-oxo-dGTP diphosphatase [Alteribacillus iranensis]
MQRVTNCVLQHKGNLLLLQKPSRNWWVAPGGKMEPGESVREAVVREFREETGLTVINPSIRGIFTFLITEQEKIISEWMMFTFLAKNWKGTLLEQSPEGILAWQPESTVTGLDMAEGDRRIFEHISQEDGVLYGTFRYTSEYKLISCELSSDTPDVSKREGDDV